MCSLRCRPQAVRTRYNNGGNIEVIRPLVELGDACLRQVLDQNRVEALVDEMSNKLKLLEKNARPSGNRTDKSVTVAADESIVAKLVKMGFLEIGSRKAVISCENNWQKYNDC